MAEDKEKGAALSVNRKGETAQKRRGRDPFGVNTVRKRKKWEKRPGDSGKTSAVPRKKRRGGPPKATKKEGRGSGGRGWVG